MSIYKNLSLKKKLISIYHISYYLIQLFIGSISRWPYYLKNIFVSKVIAKPGTLGFKGGVFNPGSVKISREKVILLAKGQKIFWWKAKGKRKKLFQKGDPIMFVYNTRKNKVSEKKIIYKHPNFPKGEIEDFRMFSFKKSIYVNHSLIHSKDDQNRNKISSVISKLDINKKTLKYFGIPKLDFSTQNIEKNWVYYVLESNLHLIYSVNPYIVLQARDSEKLEFKTIINTTLNNALYDIGNFNSRVSLSCNPIPYNEQYLILIIHQINHIFTGRCYYHWALLIDKKTHLPHKISEKPIFSGFGARGRLPGIRYITSLIQSNDEFLFFSGEGDAFSVITRIKANELDKSFKLIL